MADNDPVKSGHGYRNALFVAAIMVIVAGLRLSGEILLPFLVAGFIALLVAPPVQWLERKGVPVWLSVVTTMLGVVAVLAAFGTLLGMATGEFSAALPRYNARLNEYVIWTQDYAHQHGVPVGRGFDDITSRLEPGAVIDWVGAMLNGLLAAATSTAMVLVTLIFMLLEAAGLPRKLRAAMHDPNADLGRFAHFGAEVQRYLWIKTIVSLLTGGLIYIVVLVMGVDFPELWAIIGFLLNYIPTIGSILAAVPAVLVAFVQLGWWQATLLLGAYVVINQGVGNVLEPQLMGRTMGLSPLIVFASLVFWGWIWGPVGMLLSVPLTMVVKTWCERNEELEWLAVMMGPTPPPDEDGPALSGVRRFTERIKSMGSTTEGKIPEGMRPEDTANESLAAEHGAGE